MTYQTGPGPASDAATPRVGRVTVEMAAGGLEAVLWVEPAVGGGAAVTREQVADALARAGVRFGLDPGAVDRALTATAPERLIVARGIPAVSGRDARIEYHVVLQEAGGRPREREDGSVDLFDLGLVHNIRAGTVLAVRQPPEPGQAGCDVRGRPLPPPAVRDRPLAAGAGATLSDDGLQVVAAIDGHAVIRQGRIMVTPVFQVAGDVGVATGHVRFIGSVRVQGNVLPGFAVEAEADVEVQGTIDGGVVRAGGDVLVRGGIQGGGRGRVVAGGSVCARFIENAAVEAGTDVTAADGVLHSRVSAGRRVKVLGRRGSIIGGRVQAREEVVARVLGAYLGTVTEICVGVSPEVRAEYEALRLEQAQLTGELQRMAQATRLLQEQEQRGALSDDRRGLLLKLARTQHHQQAQLAAVAERLQALAAAMAEARGARVRAAQVLPGVRVLIGTASHTVTEVLGRVTFYLDANEQVAVGGP